MRQLPLLVLLVSLCVQPTLAACNYSVVLQGSATDANTCPTSDGLFYVAVSDTIKWSDELLPTLVETSYLGFQCATDTAVITRTSGVFIESSAEPWIDYSYYRVELARRTINVPAVKFVVSEQYSLSCARAHPSPVVINFTRSGLKLTSAEAGVRFDIDGDGISEQIGWTHPGDEVAFLIRGSMVYDGRQLFGNLSPQAPAIGDESENGYRALRLYDLNSDALIDARDDLWTVLRLWFDWNHNGISELNEVRQLDEWGVTAIELDYIETGKRDGQGNLQRQRARVRLVDGPWRWSTDFYPAEVAVHQQIEQTAGRLK